MHFKFFIAAMLFVLSACDALYHVSGQITDVDQNPLDSVQIQLPSKQVIYSDHDGRFDASFWGAGRQLIWGTPAYKIVFSKDQYASHQLQFGKELDAKIKDAKKQDSDTVWYQREDPLALTDQVIILDQ